jgi:hypothetical protein
LYEGLNADSIKPERFALVVGNARAGTTIVGAVMDSHARMICAHESMSSMNFWRRLDRRQILEEIVANSRASFATGRRSADYQFAIETEDKAADAIAVIGDKVWNPALLLMAGRRPLLAELEQEMGCPLVLVHCVRNPFDVIATMHRRSGASLRDRLRWFAMHCEAIAIIIERGDVPVTLVRNEDLIADPRAVAAQLFEWLGHPTSEMHLARISDKVYRKPNRSRVEVEWSGDLIHEVDGTIQRFPFLAGYSLD